MNKTKHEVFALGQYLHSWPDDLTYQQIIELCNDEKAHEAHNEYCDENELDDQFLQVCEAYEDYNYPVLAEMIEELRDSVERKFEAEKTLVCDVCNRPLHECYKEFEVSAYLDTHLSPTHINDKTFDDINDGIDWARSLGADFIDVYQDCNRGNRILTLNLTRGK